MLDTFDRPARLGSNVAALGDGATFDTSKMLVSRALLALGFGIIDRRLAFYTPDPDWAADLNGDRLRAVMNSPHDDDFMTEASRSFDHWNHQLVSGGVAAGSIDDEQRAELLLLLSEHSLGIGPPGATFGCARRPRRPKRGWKQGVLTVSRGVRRPPQLTGRLARLRGDDAGLRPPLRRRGFA